MKKLQNTVIRMTLAVFAAALILIPCRTQANAATVKTQKMHVQIKTTEMLRMDLDSGDYKISNLKSSKSGLLLRTTYVYASSSSSYGSATISMYAQKKGTYTVTFDVIGKDSSVKSSHSVKVYATKENGIKNVTFAGREIFYEVAPQNKGAFKVSMDKGYKLKSITMTTYDKKGKAHSKKIKNGQKVTLGTYCYRSEGSKGSSYESWSASLLARTNFEIAYTDKYTKEVKTRNYTAYRLPKK